VGECAKITHAGCEDLAKVHLWNGVAQGWAQDVAGCGAGHDLGFLQMVQMNATDIAVQCGQAVALGLVGTGLNMANALELEKIEGDFAQPLQSGAQLGVIAPEDRQRGGSHQHGKGDAECGHA
jgi:hypothetical protein